MSSCITFHEALNAESILKMDGVTPNLHIFIEENIDALKKSQGNEALVLALEKVLNRPQWLNKLKIQLARIKRK